MQRKEISLDFLEHMQPHALLGRFIHEIDVLKSSVTALKFFSDTSYLSSAYTLASMVLYHYCSKMSESCSTFVQK